VKILVLQHLASQHPGIFRDFLRQDGLSWDTIELDEGQEIPELEPYDLMIVMGGPQDVWEEDQYTWLRTEKAAIRRFVLDMRRPFLGVCLGHQLLAEAIGGKVGPAREPERGVLTVDKTAQGNQDGMLQNISNPMLALQWHGAEVFELPNGAAVLANSSACPIQSFVMGIALMGSSSTSRSLSKRFPNGLQSLPAKWCGKRWASVLCRRLRMKWMRLCRN
jgi:GMP synthase-like glutamine amidotransferase